MAAGDGAAYHRGVLLLRLGVFLVTLAALLVAAPFPVVASRWAAALVLVALLPAAWPRTGAVTAVLLVAILGWLAATTVYGEPVGFFRLVALAALLYARTCWRRWPR